MARLLHVRYFHIEKGKYGIAKAICEDHIEECSENALNSGIRLDIVKEANMYSTHGFIHDDHVYRCSYCGKTNAELAGDQDV